MSTQFAIRLLFIAIGILFSSTVNASSLARNNQMAAASQALDALDIYSVDNFSQTIIELRALEQAQVQQFETEVIEKRKRTHELNLSQETYYYYYRESANIKLRGLMTGYNADYAFRPAPESIFNNEWVNTYEVQGRLALGDLDYKGSGLVKDKTNRNIELRMLIGNEQEFEDKGTVKPYAGLGWRYMFDEGDGMISSDGHYGYDRTSTYMYLPIGVTLAMNDQGPWFGSFNMEFDYLIRGVQQSDLSNVNQFIGFDYYPDVKNVQRRGYGFRLGYNLIYRASKWHFYMQPFMRVWRIEDSDFAEFNDSLGGHNTVLEPRNRTLEIGSKFGLIF